MEYPVIDLSTKGLLNLRVANSAEERDIKSRKPVPDTLYWVKMRDGNVLRGINADGLAKLLFAIDWLDKNESARVSDELRQIRAAAVRDVEFFIRKRERALEFEAQLRRDKSLVSEKAASVSAVLPLIRRHMPAPTGTQTPDPAENSRPDTPSRSKSSPW